MSENQEQIYQSVCRICHGGCAAQLFVKNDKLVKVRPAQGSPFNLGQFCSKGLATPEMMYHPDRILTPLKRVGERGANQWQPIDWDTALNEIAEKLGHIKQTLGAESIALGQGTGRHHYMHLIRFANTLGTPNWYEPGFANCFIPRITVSNHTYGGFVSADLYGEVLPKTMLFWGRNPLVSGPDGELAFAVQNVLNKGCFGIAIDPRRSETAKNCQLWLPLRPGTDAALALAMIHVIIYENIFDNEFVEKWTTGFPELKVHVKEFTPQWAAQITGLVADDIITVARRYALNKPSVIEWGVALEQTPNSLQTVRAVAILRGLTGNIDIPGGDILGMNIIHSYPLLRDKLPFETAQKRIGGEQFKFLSGSMAMLPAAHIPGIFKAMRTGIPYPIKALLNFGSNPLTTIANSKNVYESLLNLDLLVVADMFMTPTAALADYILPAAFWPEVNQIIELPFIAQNSVTAQPKILQTGQCRQDEEIMIDLARRLNLPGCEESLEDIINYRLQPLGINFAELKEKISVFPPHEYRKFEKKGFQTLSGKVELYSEMLAMAGYDPLPTYKEPPESPVSQPETAKKFPYILITGARNRGFFHSEQRQISYLRKKRPDPLAQVHPETAAAQGIKNGDWIYVSSPRGKIKMKAALTEDIKVGVVSIDHGWWFPERVSPDFGVWESNANLLTSDKPPYDPGFGTYQLRALLCQIEKVEHDLRDSQDVQDSVVSMTASPLKDWQSYSSANNIAHNLEQAARLFPDKIGLIFENHSFTFTELDEASHQIANGLSSLGISRGDCVVLFLPNIPAFITAYFGIQKLGAIAVIVNSALTAREVTFIGNDSGAVALITTENLRERVVEKELPQLKHILIAKNNGIDLPGFKNLEGLKIAKMNADEPSAILYTSGTTGFPKGAVISHGNILFDARTTAYMYRLQPTDKVLLFSPLSHSFILSAGLNTCVQTASTIVLHRDFEPEAILDSLVEHKISYFYGSTPVYAVLLDQATPEQMQSVRFYISGGATMPLELAENWQQKFGININISYGLTECSQCCFNHFLKTKLGSVGSPVEGVTLKIVDEDGQEVMTGEAGEMVVKSPKVISGYWNRPAESAEAIKDGWFYTGDIGMMDEEGYIFITDRKKDMLNVGGVSVYPSEIETTLCQHPAVLEAAVYGIPVAIMGEQVCAAVVLQTEKKATEHELIAYCRELMADYKVPSVIRFVESLPKAKSGKILKRLLRDQAESISVATNTQVLSAELIKNWIADWLSSEFEWDSHAIQAELAFTEYGLTSILTMKLMRDMGCWAGKSVNPVLAWHYPTVELLANYLAEIWNTSSEIEAAKIQPVSRNRDIPLSFVQEELWHVCQQSQEQQQIWGIPYRWQITGKLAVNVLKHSFADLTQRHEILRTTFPVKNGQPIQKIAVNLAIDFPIIDLTDKPELEKNREVERLIQQENRQILDLTKGPVWCVKLIRLEEKSHILLVYIHHIIIDATSGELFIRELSELYESRLSGKPSSLKPLTIQYADYACWQRAFYTQQRLEDSVAYYQQLLIPEPPRLNLPLDKPRIAEGDTFPAAFKGFELLPALTNDLKALSRQAGTTFFTTLLTAWGALLHRHTGCEDISVGVPMSKRFHSGTESLIGYFAGQIVIRITVKAEVSFFDLLNQVQQVVQTAISQQELSSEQISRALGKESFDGTANKYPYHVAINFLPTPVNEIKNSTISIYYITEDLRKKMFLDLAMPVWEESGDTGVFLKGGFRYRSDLFEVTTINKMIDNFKVLLSAVSENPNQPIKNINLKF